MSVKVALTGNYAVAYAVKMAKPGVIAAYPITPQTPIVEKLAEFIDKGELKAKMVRVESEHSALAVCFGAAVAGVRTFTATSSQGLLYMHEWVHWVSRARIPIVMAIVSRTINTPWNIWPDHSDFMDQRDAGWIMAYAMDSQEAFDLTLQAFKISEDPAVFLPVMVGIEGFIVGHTTMPVEIPGEEAVDQWLGERRQPYVVDGSEPLGLGGMTYPEDTEEMFYGVHEAMENAKNKIKAVDEEYGKLFGRKYGGSISCYECNDAKFIAISMGAWSGDLIDGMYRLRSDGYPVGVLRIRFYRPFPIEDIWEKVKSAKGIIVFDRAISFGAWGQIYTDLIAGISMYARKLPYVANIVAGIAGVNVTAEDFYSMVKSFIDGVESGELEKGFFAWKRARG